MLSPTAAIAESRHTLDGWRFCVNCFELFLVDFTVDQRLCPRNRGLHQAAGWTFRLTYNLSPAGMGEDASTQSDWRHRYRCAALYWAPSAAQRCPAGGAHSYIHPGGYPRQFLLPHDIGETVGPPPLRQAVPGGFIVDDARGQYAWRAGGRRRRMPFSSVRNTAEATPWRGRLPLAASSHPV